MAKHLSKFSKPFQNSRIPFLLAEVITNGSGEMVDLICRFANAPAAAVLGLPPQELTGRRFTRELHPGGLFELAPLQAVAFSGSAATFVYHTAAGSAVQVTCYQVMYGVVGCVLEFQGEAPHTPAAALAETLPGAVALLELSRSGLRCLNFNQRLCDLTSWNRRELLDRFAEDFSALVVSQDWPDLLQALLDASREGRTVDHEVRVLRRDAPPVWINFRSERICADGGSAVFYAMLLDVDQSHRSQARLAETLAQLETTRDRLLSLFDTLPGGFALFRRDAGGALEPLHLSRKLAELLEYPAAELFKRLRAEPLCRVVAADREGLTAALIRSRVGGLPLRQACRMRTRSGQVLWIFLEAAWQPQEDGGDLLYIACSDVTQEKQTEAELRLRTQLCDLLLERSHIISFDYDPAEDVAHVETCGDGGRRATQRVEAYLQTLEGTQAVHPEDRKRLVTALRRAAARPGTGTLEYRGNYDGRGWRWYRVSLVSLFDNRGNVYRLLGKAEDISDRKAAAQRFHELTVQQKKWAKSSLAAARLDLTANRILDARGSSRHLMRVLFGNSADACLRHIRDNIPEPAQQREFYRRFSPSALLTAFYQGGAHHGFEHRFTLEDGTAVWVRSMLELAEDPESRHVEAFYSAVDVDAQHQSGALLTQLLPRDYDLVLTVDAASGRCCSHGGRSALPAGTVYRAAAAQYARSLPPGKRRSALRRALQLETILARLELQPLYEVPCPAGEKCESPRRLRCSWLDREAGLLLITLQSS